MGRGIMGLQKQLRRKLASAHLVVSHARRRTLRNGSGGASPDQPGAAHRQYATAFRTSACDDWRVGPECVRGRTVCGAPAPRGIGGLGVRAEGCAEHAFVVARALGLPRVCATTTAGSLSCRSCVPCCWTDGETDAGYSARDITPA